MPNPQKQQTKVNVTLERDFKTMLTYVITDRGAIAALAAAGVKCMLLTLRAGDAFAVFQDTVEFRKALRRLMLGKLDFDALEYMGSLDELNWRLAEKAYDQAQQK